MIGTTPWPAQFWNDRATFILYEQQLVTGRNHRLIIDPGIPLSPTVRARDVDRQPALLLLQLTAAAVGGCVTADSGDSLNEPHGAVRITIPRGTGIELVWSAAAWAVQPTPDTDYERAIPSGAVEDVPRVRQQNDVRNRIAIGYAPDANTSLTLLVQDQASVIAYGPAEEQIATDADSPATPVVTRAQNILAARAVPQWRMNSPARIVGRDTLDARTPLALIDMDGRHGRYVKLTGPLPVDVSPYQRISAGSVAVRHGKVRAALGLEPATFAGPSPVTFAELADFASGSYYWNSARPLSASAGVILGSLATAGAHQ